MEPRARRILRWALGITLVVLLAGVALLVTIYAQISGGWDEVLDRSHPEATDPQVVAARQAAGGRLDSEVERLVASVVVPSLSGARVAQPGAVGAGVREDPAAPLGSGGCETGEHNWKIDDPYDLACTEVRRTVLAASSEDVRSQLVALNSALHADGCQADDVSGLQFPIDAWDRDRDDTAGEPTHGSQDLPRASCRTGDGSYEVTIIFDDFELYTGRPPPEAAEGEFQFLLEVSTESFLA